jgi:hypothetical protein
MRHLLSLVLLPILKRHHHKVQRPFIGRLVRVHRRLIQYDGSNSKVVYHTFGHCLEFETG